MQVSDLQCVMSFSTTIMIDKHAVSLSSLKISLHWLILDGLFYPQKIGLDQLDHLGNLHLLQLDGCRFDAQLAKSILRFFSFDQLCPNFTVHLN